jgi:hypothetical protein
MKEGATYEKQNKLTSFGWSSRIPSRVRDLWIHLLQMIKMQNKPKILPFHPKNKDCQKNKPKCRSGNHEKTKQTDRLCSVIPNPFMGEGPMAFFSSNEKTKQTQFESSKYENAKQSQS